MQMQLVDGALLLEVRYMLGGLQQRLAGHARYRRLQRTLTHSFPEAMPGRLAGELCPICLDGMRVRGAGQGCPGGWERCPGASFACGRHAPKRRSNFPSLPTPPHPTSLQAGKQLPCSHCVHTSCLLAWLQQQSSVGGSKFTCPMCRADLDVQPAPSKHHGPLRSLGAAARGLLLTAMDLLAAAGQTPPPRGSPAPGSRAAVRGSRHAPSHTPHAPAVVRPAAPEPGPAEGSKDVGPTRRVTRLQARLAAAQASAAPPASRGPGRQRHRIDGMLD